MTSATLVDYRIALLIDADNAPAAKIETILSELSKHGVTNVRRAYGNWKKPELKAWEERLHEFAIRPMQQFDYSKGKNASDMAMVIDAMELLYVDHPQAFAIVSSDADFTPLAMHLKSKGAFVYGFGQKHAPEPFVKACTKFLFLDQLDSPETIPSSAPITSSRVPETNATSTAYIAALENAAEIPGAPAAQLLTQRSATPSKLSPDQLKRDNKLIGSLRESVAASEDESGWAKVGAVGSHMANKSSFDSRNFGYPTLTKLMVATDAFDFQDEGTPQVRVKIRRSQTYDLTKATKPQSFGSKTARGKTTPLASSNGTELPVDPSNTKLETSVETVKKILEAAPDWAVGDVRTLTSLGKSLRERNLKRPDETLKAFFAKYPDYFELTPSDGPKEVRLVKTV